MSLKLQDEYADDVQVLFVEVSNKPDVYVQQFMIQKKWMGGRALWTREKPFESGSKYIPSAVLLSSEGKVLWRGSPTDGHGKIVDLIDDDLKAAKKAPADVPDAVGKAYVDFNKGNYAKALAAAQAILDKPPAKDAAGLVSAATKAVETFKARIDARFARVESLVDQGYFAAATEQLADLGRGLKGHAEFTSKHAEALADLQSDRLATEREAADALAKLEKKLYDKGPDNGTAKALEALADKFAGTKAAERATQLAEVAREEES